MKILSIIIVVTITLVLVLAWIGMWKSNSDPLTDYDLYGMDSEEYLNNMLLGTFKNKTSLIFC